MARVATLIAALLLVLPSTAAGTFPGANGRIAFDNSPVFSVLSDGSGLLQLASPADFPAVSASGDLVAFSRVGGGGYGIWVVNPDGSGARQVTTDPAPGASNDSRPAWSPDGTRIAFVRNNDLFVMNADGSGSTNLTPPGVFASSVDDPEWSPTGDEIVFGGTDNQIYAINAGGGAPVQLTPAGVSPGNRSNPSWSPDGARIAYSLNAGANAGIWTIDRATAPNEALQVTTGGEMWELSWSPDGTKFGFAMDVGNPAQEELWVVNVDGSGLTQLNVDAGTAMDWGVASTLQPPPAAPVLGERVNVEEVSGTVLVGVRGGGSARAAQKGVDFVPLSDARQIPVGSFLDTKRGTVRLTSAADDQGATQSGTFVKGLFQVLQARSGRDRGVTELRLKGASFNRCRVSGRGRRASAARRRLSSRTVRRLRGDADGKFRTRGRHSSATVRGTVWITSDRCDGTLTQVKRGRVAVRDLRRKRTIVVRTGKRYLARAPG